MRTDLRVKLAVFDWGGTVMADTPSEIGPMAYWSQVSAIPGIAEALHEMNGAYTLALATNSRQSNSGQIRKALSRVNLAEYFGAIFTREMLGTTKSDPGFYRKIIGHFGFEGCECLMVGNTYELDVVPARAAGMITVYLSQSRGYFPQANFVIRSLSHLPSVLEIVEEADFQI